MKVKVWAESASVGSRVVRIVDMDEDQINDGEILDYILQEGMIDWGYEIIPDDANQNN